MQASPLPTRKKGKAPSGQNIKVFVRCRPMNSQEKASKSHMVVSVQGGREVMLKERPGDKYAKTFTFDHVFGPDSKQVDVYKAVAKNSVEEVLNGFNCTIFAYGQTGTGKTFTMEGERAHSTTSWEEDPLAGIIPRCVNHLFDELRMQKVEFTMRVSFLELYNEELFDLLSAHDDLSKLRLYEDASKKGSCIIQGLEEVLVRSKSDVYSIMEKGSTKRQTAATLMNAHSSRSHTVFTVTVHMKENTLDGDELLKTGKLHLVDLAGSENIGRSGAVDKRAREAGNINMSLLTLGRVITSLVEKAPHIPYRESKLTRLLQDALGGRTKTSVIATVSPASSNQEETLSTLEYAHRAKNIQNKPEVNQKLNKKELIGEYTQEIERLRRDLLAVREKSGVYLANENYQEMIATMECQANEITEKIAHIRTLEADLEKKTELFSQVSEELEKTSKELTSTQEKLSSTKTTLSCTQKLLHTTAQEREEQRYLVSAHSKTEEKLHCEGQTLINVATSTSSDLTRLHDKLDRRRNVDSRNAEVFQSFQDSYCSFQDSFIRELSESLDTHTNQLNTATTLQCDRVRACVSVLGSTCEDLAALGKTQTQLKELAVKGLNTMVESLVQGVKDAEVEGRSKVDGVGAKLDSLVATQKAILEHLATLITTAAATVTTHRTALTNQLTVMESSCDELKRKIKSLTASLIEAASHRHSTVMGHVNQCEAICAKDQEETDAHMKEINSQIQLLTGALANLQTQVLGLSSSREKHSTSLRTNLAEVKEESQQGQQEVKRRAEEGGNDACLLVQNLYQSTVQMREQTEENIEKLDSVVSEIGSVRCEFGSAVEACVGEAHNGLEGVRQSMKNSATTITENTRTSALTVQRQIESNHTSTATSLATHSNTVQREAEGLTEGERELVEGLEGVEEGLTEWKMQVEDKLHLQTARVTSFLTQDIVEDKPTGQTPGRREYSFPSTLPATSPHERLLRRYRAATSTSVNPSRIPLPSLGDDTEDDLGDSSTLSASSSDSPATPQDDTFLNTTTTEPRSRSGSVSSLKDQGQFAVPRPPLQREDSGIPLSRSSSSSSITDGKENVRSSSSKKRELKQPTVFKSTSLEKLSSNSACEGRTRRILGSQN